MDREPLISVIVPTIGRDTLTATLQSIPDVSDIEVIVVADGREAWAKTAAQLPHSRPVIVNHNHDWSDTVGHAQRTIGMRHARGHWLSFMDDDDTYTPDAFNIIRETIRDASPVPHIFRMRYATNREVLWDGPSLIRGNVGSPMFVVPNNPLLLGRWKPERCGDFDFIEKTVSNYGGRVEWSEEVIAIVRPHECHTG